MRVFLAIDIEPDNKLKVSKCIDGLKQFRADVKWVEQQNIHLTLKFIGEISSERFRTLADTAKEALAQIPSGSIGFSGLGVFPDWKQPRVFWIGIDKGKDFLQSLFNELDNELARVGFEREGKPFSPHLTIGRARSQRDIDKLLPALKDAENAPEFGTRVSNITIFKSELTPRGPIYSVLDRIKLNENL